MGLIGGNQTIKTLVIHYLFTKTISVNNGKITCSFIYINRSNTNVPSLKTWPWPRLLPSIYPLLKNSAEMGHNLAQIGWGWVIEMGEAGLNFKPNLLAFRREIRPKFLVANFRNPIFSLFFYLTKNKIFLINNKKL